MNKVKEIFNLLAEWKFHIIIILIMVIIAVFGIWDTYNQSYFIGEDKPITLYYLFAFLGAIATLYVTVYIHWQGVKNQKEQRKIQAQQIKIQERQIDRQIEKEIDDSFTTAVNSLGNNETSVRTVAIYSLYQHATEYKKYREQIVERLCSHIRSKTQEEEYQKQYKDKPSNEIQTAIDLLFRKTGNTGLYHQFRQDLPNADLSSAYCAGANFEGADCQGAYFAGTVCRWANLGGADCRWANFEGAYCEGAYFAGASCHGANLGRAFCQRANFMGTYCQAANFGLAHCQEANFLSADCQGANFWGTHCQGAYFSETDCQGANFWGIHCQGAYFSGVHCQGGNFKEAHCQGTDFRVTDCQGAYGSDQPQSLQSRIGKDTELDKVIITEGALSKESIDAIEKAKPYCSSNWYAEMQKIIEANKGKEEKRGIPNGIISGVLEDSEELQRTIKLLEDIGKSKNL